MHNIWRSENDRHISKRGESMKDSNKVLISAWICTALVVIESMIINQNTDNAWVLLIPGLITLTNFLGIGGNKDDME